tara:strand:+ start:425 stop:532 length:108 start_codon:yes stop_codon:yes gene_type:complete
MIDTGLLVIESFFIGIKKEIALQPLNGSNLFLWNT